ncbi:MAG TPA: ABC transporter ATP-binding protein, partial [Candidatus Polarisedimenticolia bacterium]|nr:ABC transporter ATP-binding protein [Candidatus Polarisedimenticolia bacterium]
MTAFAEHDPGDHRAAAAPLLEASALTFLHHGAPSALFEGLSLTLPQGQFAGVIGPNGSGK